MRRASENRVSASAAAGEQQALRWLTARQLKRRCVGVDNNTDKERCESCHLLTDQSSRVQSAE